MKLRKKKISFGKEIIGNQVSIQSVKPVQKLEEIKNNKNRPKIDDDFDETGETLFG